MTYLFDTLVTGVGTGNCQQQVVVSFGGTGSGVGGVTGVYLVT